jgi:tetratricopeptide (TPR) repeat protein
MSKSKIMKVFHQYNKDYLLSCGFTKVNDVYVKLSQEKDCLMTVSLWVHGGGYRQFYNIEALFSVDDLYYDDVVSKENLILSDYRSSSAARLQGFLAKYLDKKIPFTIEGPFNSPWSSNVEEVKLVGNMVELSLENPIVIDEFMKALHQILRNEVSFSFQCQNYDQALIFFDEIHKKLPREINIFWEFFNERIKENTINYNIIKEDYATAIEGFELLINRSIEQRKSAIEMSKTDLENGNAATEQFINDGRLTEKQKNHLRELSKEQHIDTIELSEKIIKELTEKKDTWLTMMLSDPTHQRDRLIQIYQQNIKELQDLMEGKFKKTKKSQIIAPPSAPLLDNLDRLLIRRGDESWNQVQTHMDEFFKAKSYRRIRDREMWERVWCIVETKNFWIIMEVEERDVSIESLRDYDEISKYMTRELITSGFFLYSFEFTDSLARLYDQGECVDHWVIDVGVEEDEQEISQPQAWESSKIANPYRLKDPEVVHLIDIIFEWMEILEINPQWMVEEVDSTQNFKKCHIFGYAVK